MSSSKTPPDESVLVAVNRRAIPVLVGAMLFVTGVAVVLGGLALYGRLGRDHLATVLAEYFWIIFWTGLAEGLALAVGILVFWLVSRRITRPISDLARAVSEQKNNSEVPPFDTRGPIREVNQLAASFNDLFATRERQTQELQTLTRNVLHDLRTPLAHIRQGAELVHDGKTEAVPTMESIAEACNSLLAIVDTNSEISTNYADAERTPASEQDLSEIIATLADLYSAVADVKGVSFDVRTPSAPLRFNGHRHKLQQMLSNLLDNAFKFTPAGGRVTFAAEATDGQIRISVADTGIGISDESRPHIFKRFYRAPTNRPTPGNGLGLSLVHAIVAFYRGTVTCTSANGQGTTFTVVLPQGE